MALGLVCALVLSSNLGAYQALAADFVRPELPKEGPVVPETPALSPIPNLPTTLSVPEVSVEKLEVPTPLQTETPAPAVEVLQAIQPQPGAEKNPVPPTIESGPAQAGRPFDGGGAAVSGPSAEPVTASSRSDMIDAFLNNREERASLQKSTIKTWIKSGVVMVAGPLITKTVFQLHENGSLGTGGAKWILGAAAAYGIWLMAKVAYLAVRTRRASGRAAALTRLLIRDAHPRTAEQTQEAIKALDEEARRHAVARRVQPEFAELFRAARDYGVDDEKAVKDMAHLENFLAEVRSGEREQWRLGSMTYHLLAGSESAFDALRAKVWNDPAVGVEQAMGLEDHILDLRKSLATEHRPGYMPGRELQFIQDRMDEMYASIPRGLDRRKAALVDRQLQRLELEELRDGRPQTARLLRELRKDSAGELAVVGSDPKGLNDDFAEELAKANRERIDDVLKSIPD
jgi:hypothetical protein